MPEGRAAAEQRETVRREFSKQASNFESSGSLFRDGGVLEWIAAHIEVPPQSRILDVAGGTGQLGRHLARDGATAVIVDLTDAMLATGLRDPSHTRALPEDEFRAMFAAVGRDTRREADWEQPMPVERWFEQAKTPGETRDRVRGAFQQEADGGDETGLRATQGDEGLTITQRCPLLGG